jgi:hypothetical protein
MSKLRRQVLVNGAVYIMKLTDIVAHLKKLQQNMAWDSELKP